MKIIPIAVQGFSCARTCRTEERVDLCRFMPLFALLGEVTVTSHTTSVKVQFKDREVLKEAVTKLGGTVLGEGTYALYAGRNKETGLGFQLRGWRAPAVLQGDTLKVDEWGNEAGCTTVAQLTAEYVFGAARKSARQNGWSIVSEGAMGLVLRHPSGGKLTVKPDGTCDASGFTGGGCHASKDIEDAIGERGTRRYKPEFNQRGTVSNR